MLRILGAGCALLMLPFTAHAVDAIHDDARLLQAGRDQSNWLTYSRDYSNQRFSPLTQINAATVGRLVPRWIYQSGVASTFQASPIVVDGVMYVSLPFNHVVAIDARNGPRAVALSAQTPHREDVLRTGQPRRRSCIRQGVHRDGRCAPACARPEERQGGLGHSTGGRSG
jgi:glucose dehydrogenase